MKKKNRISGSIRFLLIILILYLIVFLFSISVAKEAFLNFLIMFVKIIPILGMVFLIMMLTNLFFTTERIKKHLGEESGWKGWIYAMIAGIIISGPPYILFPLLGELRKGGMKNSLMAVFLYNRNVKIQFLPVMVYYFGLNFTLILSLYIIIFSIFNGQIIGWFLRDRLQGRSSSEE